MSLMATSNVPDAVLTMRGDGGNASSSIFYLGDASPTKSFLATDLVEDIPLWKLADFRLSTTCLSEANLPVWL